MQALARSPCQCCRVRVSWASEAKESWRQQVMPQDQPFSKSHQQHRGHHQAAFFFDSGAGCGKHKETSHVNTLNICIWNYQATLVRLTPSVQGCFKVQRDGHASPPSFPILHCSFLPAFPFHFLATPAPHGLWWEWDQGTDPVEIWYNTTWPKLVLDQISSLVWHSLATWTSAGTRQTAGEQDYPPSSENTV